MLSKNPNYKLENPISVILFASIVLSYIASKYFLSIINSEVKWVLASKERLEKELERIKEKGANLEYIATHDFLTDIPNRKAFITKLRNSLKYAKRYKAKLAILYIDLDNFKKVNDSYGHSFGDKLLKEVAIRIQETIRETDFLARLGGDEFVVMFYGMDINPKIIADKILKRLREPYILEAGSKKIDYISASIGISVYPIHSENYEALINIADKFMYKAKKTKNLYYSEDF